MKSNSDAPTVVLGHNGSGRRTLSQSTNSSHGYLFRKKYWQRIGCRSGTGHAIPCVNYAGRRQRLQHIYACISHMRRGLETHSGMDKQLHHEAKCHHGHRRLVDSRCTSGYKGTKKNVGSNQHVHGLEHLKGTESKNIWWSGSWSSNSAATNKGGNEPMLPSVWDSGGF